MEKKMGHTLLILSLSGWCRKISE